MSVQSTKTGSNQSTPGQTGDGTDASATGAKAKKRFRAIFVSDVHLGTASCKADRLVNFLDCHDTETLYLVGDIIDGWALQRSIYWTVAQTDVVRSIIRKARQGTRVVYVPGNHDEFLRDYAGTDLLGIELRLEAVHETADGRRLLVIHGDQFDGPVRYGRMTRWLGTGAYKAGLRANDFVAWLCRVTGRDYWSFSGYLKRNVGQASQFIKSFEAWAAHEAARRGFDGVVCGHIHHSALHAIGDVLYANDGDWVETCTALVEDETDGLRLVRWTRPNAVSAAPGHGPETPCHDP